MNYTADHRPKRTVELKQQAKAAPLEAVAAMSTYCAVSLARRGLLSDAEHHRFITWLDATLCGLCASLPD